MMDYRIEYEISAILILVILMVYFLVKPRRFLNSLIFSFSIVPQSFLLILQIWLP